LSVSKKVIVSGYDNAKTKLRNEAAEIIEQTTLDLQASAARRRNNNAGHTQASNSAQSHPESSSNAPQRTSVANGGAQPTNSSNNVAHPTQPGNTKYVDILPDTEMVH
jgi:hypothetical protein